MKKKVIHTLTFVVMIMLAVGMFSITANAASVTASGTCGENLTWILDDEGTLTISGTGEMDDLSHKMPWKEARLIIENVVIDNGVTTIGNSAFSNCSNIKSVTIPSSVTRIGTSAFYFCENLTSVTFEEESHLESIGARAFYYCSGISDMRLPNRVSDIDSWAFRGCYRLKSITIPKSVMSIGEKAFSECNQLSDIFYMGTQTDKNNIYIDSDNETLKNATWHYSSCIGSAEHFDGWIIDKENNCGVSGIKHIECSICHTKWFENTIISATGSHSYDDICDDICNVCEQSRTAPHNYRWVIDKENNCGVEGIKHEECSLCHARCNENTTISATGSHSYDDVCDDCCNVCEQSRTAPHNWKAATIDKPKTCTNCGLTEGVSLGTEYVIIYHLGGGINAENNPDVYTVVDTIILEDATKDGYTFVGWFLDAAKTNQINEISNRTGNLDLYAKFAPKTYEATFDFQGGTTSDPITIILDDTIGTTKKYVVDNGSEFNPYQMWRSPKRDGYVFVGWQHNDRLVSGTVTSKGDIELTALWSPIDRDHSIVLGAGTSYIQNNGTLWTGPFLQGTESVYSGNLNSFRSTYVVYISGVYKNINYTGRSYNKQYYENNASSPSLYYASGGFEIYDVTNQKYLVEADGEKDIDTFYSGTTFNKTKNYNGILEVKPGTILAITIYGKSNDKQYNSYLGGAPWNIPVGSIFLQTNELRDAIKIECSDKEKLILQKYDATIQTPTVSKDGYVFRGWYDENDLPITDTWQYLDNKTFYAKWMSVHTVVFEDINGEIISSGTYCMGDEIIAPEYPAIESDEICSYTAKWDNNYTGICVGDAVYTVIIDAKGHTNADPIIENRAEPTCTKDGNYDSVVYCSVCNEELSRETKPIDKLGHEFIDVESKAADCLNPGYTAYKDCSRCDYIEGKGEIPALGHPAGNAIEENRVEPTHTECGSCDIVVYCSVCNVELSREHIILDKIAIMHSGQCGDNLTWTLYKDGELVIEGTGAMWEYDDSNNKAPWRNYSGRLTTLTLCEGITTIGNNAFFNCSGLTEDLIVPDSVTTIGDSAFFGCDFNNIYFEGNAPSAYAASHSYPSFDTDVTLYYLPATTGWVDSEYYDAVTGTWNGYKFEVWNTGFKYSLTGTVNNHNPAVSTTITLVQNGETVYTYSIESKSGSGAVTQEFVLSDIAEGVYDIVITKSNHLSYTIKDISIDDDIDLREHENPLISEITLIAGDVNNDGCVDLKDVTLLTSSNTYGKTYDEAISKSADMDGDMYFDLKDLVIITSSKNYGKAPIVVAYK